MASLGFCIAIRRSTIPCLAFPSPILTNRPALVATGEKIPFSNDYLFLCTLSQPSLLCLVPKSQMFSFTPRPTFVSVRKFPNECFHRIDATGRRFNFMEYITCQHMSLGYVLCSVSDVSRVYDQTFHVPPSTSRTSANNCAIVG